MESAVLQELRREPASVMELLPDEKSPLRVIAAAGGAVGFGACAWAFYERFYRWRDCFNDVGRCYDPDGSGQVYTTAGQVWGWMALMFLAVAVAGVVMSRRRPPQ